MAKGLVGNKSNISANLLKGFVGNTSGKACKLVKGFVGDARNKAQLFWSAIAEKIKVTWDTVEYIGTGYMWRLDATYRTDLTVDGAIKKITDHRAISNATTSENGLCTISGQAVYRYDSTQSKYVLIIASNVLLNHIKTLEPFSTASSVSFKKAFLSGNGDELLVHVYSSTLGHGIVVFNIHEDGTWSEKKNYGIVDETTTSSWVISAVSIDLTILAFSSGKIFMLNSSDEYENVTKITFASNGAFITIDKKFLIVKPNNSTVAIYYINGTAFTKIGSNLYVYASLPCCYNPTTMMATFTRESYDTIYIYALSETSVTKVCEQSMNDLHGYDWEGEFANYESDEVVFDYAYTNYVDETHDGKRAFVTMYSKSEISYNADSDYAGEIMAETHGIYEYDVSRFQSGAITAMSRRQRLSYSSKGYGSALRSNATFAKYLNPSEL